MRQSKDLINQEPTIFEPHSDKQEEAVLSDSQLVVLGTGVQWGKTLTGAHWMNRMINTYQDKDDNFLICAPTYKILEQSTLPHFKAVTEGFGEYKAQRAVFETYWGTSIYFRTNQNPDSIVGIPNVRAIWGDEAGKFTLYFWENIQGRQSTKNCPIMLTTSPYTLNWIYRDIIRPKREGKRKDVHLIQAATWENPFNSLSDPKILAEKRTTMDPRRLSMLFGGEWGKMQGLVYDCWDDDENLIDPIALPVGTRFFAGVDWGFTDPFVILIRAITPDGMRYGVSEFYKSGLTVSDMVQAAKQKKTIYNIETFFCDPSQPGHIEEFNRNGLSAVPAENNIRLGIDAHYELIKSRKYKEFRGMCPHSEDERQTYHYPETKDFGPDDKQKENLPVDANNHAQDAARYLTLGTRHISKEKPIKVPLSTSPFDQILRAKKRGATEKWS